MKEYILIIGKIYILRIIISSSRADNLLVCFKLPAENKRSENE